VVARARALMPVLALARERAQTVAREQGVVLARVRNRGRRCRRACNRNGLLPRSPGRRFGF